MRKRHVVPQRRVKISTKPVEPPPVLDSSLFDKIDAEAVKKAFTENYQRHRDFLIQLVTSQMALDTAMTNVDNGLREHTNGAVEIRTEKVRQQVEQAYTVGLRLYLYEEVIGKTIADPTAQTEVFKALLALPSLTREPPKALVRGKSAVEKSVNDLEQELDRRIGPAGEDRTTRKGRATIRKRSVPK